MQITVTIHVHFEERNQNLLFNLNSHGLAIYMYFSVEILIAKYIDKLAKFSVVFYHGEIVS